MRVDSRLKYADAITLDRIRFLHPTIREKVLNAYLSVNAFMLGKGVRLRFSSTLRSVEVQDQFYAIGRTKLYDSKGKRLGVITKAKGGQSIHNYGLAFDIVLLIDADSDGRFEKASWDVYADFDGDNKADWMECVDAFKAIGAEWGGNWGWKDKPHLQFSFGMKWQEMKAKLADGDFFTELIDGKEYKWIKLGGDFQLK